MLIDMVYNHTSPDSVLVREHPEWFYRNLIDGSEVEVHRGRIYADKKPVIVAFADAHP